MNDPMTILKADHRAVTKMLSTLADSDEGPERENLVEELQAALTLHMKIEEELVYPLVAEHVGAEDEEEAEVEHKLAREGLEKVTTMVQQPGFGAAVEMLLAGIKHHVNEEETEILPELKTALDRKQWLALGDAMADAKGQTNQTPTHKSRSPRKSSKRRSSTTTANSV